MKQGIWLIWAVCFPALLAAQHAPSTVFGTVTASGTGEPLVGVQLLLNEGRYGVTSDVDGQYIFEGLPPGDYVLKAQAIGFEPNEQAFSLTDGVKRPVHFTLEVADDTRSPDGPVAHWRSVSLAPASVSTTLAGERVPFTKTEVTAEELQKRDAAQDLPFLLRYTPALVVTSDAGAGVGYTGMRIRGSDATRINVTINGVPLNDAESHQVYWVDLPDLGSSADGIQIQRGVGTSTNGPGAFGATVGVNTLAPEREPMGRMAFSAGAFNTRRATLQWASGVGERGFFAEGRASRILSDGYMDRATSDLSSVHTSAGKQWESGQLVYTGLWGHERTYQAWYGVPVVGLTGDADAITAWAANSYEYGYGADTARIADLIARGRQHNYYTYEDQVDDYTQIHHQLHLDQRMGQWDAGLALSNTLGRGHYEQFRADDDLAHYGVTDTAFATGDVVRRRWLDNALYGVSGSVQRTLPAGSVQFGGGGYRYDGAHFGRVVWAEHAPGLQPGHRYYDGMGRKRDANVFARAMRTFASGDLRVHGELQWRTVGYEVDGTDNDLRVLAVEDALSFWNPKVGVDFQNRPDRRFYASYAMGHREPSRTDYVDSPEGTNVRPERLQDWEVGGVWMEDRWTLRANGYFMDYTDQLVLTGDLNDVGSPLRTNVAKSYRAGIELDGRWSPVDGLVWQPNLAWSTNRIQQFDEVIFDYDPEQPYRQVNTYEDAPIAYSPSVVATSILAWEAWAAGDHSLIVEWALRHVGEQFLDNTGSAERALSAYAVNDLRLRYSLSKERDVLSLNVFVNNVLGEEYSANGWAYSYQNGGPASRVSEVYVYPQAGRFVTVGLDWSWH